MSYLVFCCLVLAHAIYVGYGDYFATIQSNHPGLTQQEYYKLHSTIAVSSDHPLFRGEDFAPDQYRIGVVFAGKLIGDGIGLQKYYICYSVFDFFCALGAGLLCYATLIISELFLQFTEEERGRGVVLLLLAITYPLAWTVPWERPETLPSALYLVLCIELVRRKRSSYWATAGILVATLWQSFVRTDIPMVLGVALLLLAVLRTGRRWRYFGIGAGILMIAAAIQAFLQFILFPDAMYPHGLRVVHLAENLQPRQLVVVVIALLPWVLLMRLLVRYRKEMEPGDVLAAIASCLYVPLWWAVGIVSEVRLFVPFLLAMTPTAAKLMVLFLRGDGARANEGVRLESS